MKVNNSFYWAWIALITQLSLFTLNKKYKYTDNS